MLPFYRHQLLLPYVYYRYWQWEEEILHSMDGQCCLGIKLLCLEQSLKRDSHTLNSGSGQSPIGESGGVSIYLIF